MVSDSISPKLLDDSINRGLVYAHMHSIAPSEPPVQGIFPLELTWFLTPFPKASFR